jgi:hypothetical protein
MDSRIDLVVTAELLGGVGAPRPVLTRRGATGEAWAAQWPASGCEWW